MSLQGRMSITQIELDSDIYGSLSAQEPGHDLVFFSSYNALWAFLQSIYNFSGFLDSFIIELCTNIPGISKQYAESWTQFWLLNNPI